MRNSLHEDMILFNHITQYFIIYVNNNKNSSIILM